MALLKSTTLIADGNTDIPLKNKVAGIENTYTIGASGDFGSGAITISLSVDGGTTFITDIAASSPVTFTDDFLRTFGPFNSDEMNPVILRVGLASSTNPDIDLRVYNVA